MSTREEPSMIGGLIALIVLVTLATEVASLAVWLSVIHLWSVICAM